MYLVSLTRAALRVYLNRDIFDAAFSKLGVPKRVPQSVDTAERTYRQVTIVSPNSAIHFDNLETLNSRPLPLVLPWWTEVSQVR